MFSNSEVLKYIMFEFKLVIVAAFVVVVLVVVLVVFKIHSLHSSMPPSKTLPKIYKKEYFCNLHNYTAI